MDDLNRVHLMSFDGSQFGVLSCEKNGVNELVFGGEIKGEFTVMNFGFASDSECSALLEKVDEADGLDAGKILVIELNLASRKIEQATY